MKGFAVTIAVLFLSGGASFAGNAAAPPPAPHAGPAHFPCAADNARFCATVPMGNGRRVLCLARHEAELAPACKPVVKSMLAMYNQGVERHRQTMVTVQRMEAEQNEKAGPAKNKPAASPQKKPAPVPPPSSPPPH